MIDKLEEIKRKLYLLTFSEENKSGKVSAEDFGKIADERDDLLAKTGKLRLSCGICKTELKYAGGNTWECHSCDRIFK